MLIELHGREFDWFAIDSEGSLALFATAGEGFIPQSASDCFSKHDAISESLLAPHVGTTQVWSDYAAQGLFVFDWSLPSGPYKKCVNPSVSIAQDLKSKIMSIANLPTFSGSFKTLNKLTQWPTT